MSDVIDGFLVALLSGGLTRLRIGVFEVRMLGAEMCGVEVFECRDADERTIPAQPSDHRVGQGWIERCREVRRATREAAQGFSFRFKSVGHESGSASSPLAATLPGSA